MTELVVPRPAASVLLVRAGAPRGVEVYMIRRQKTMRFLGGYYAFPGGRVDALDASADLLARCRGVAPADAARVVPRLDGLEPLARARPLRVACVHLPPLSRSWLELAQGERPELAVYVSTRHRR